jgi:putative protease
MVLFDFLRALFNHQKEKKKKSYKKTKKITVRKLQKKTKKKVKKKTHKKIQKKPRKKIYKKIKTKPPRRTQLRRPHRYPKETIEKPKEKVIGVITHYFGKISVGVIKLSAGLKVGDKIHIKGAHDDFTQVVESMQFNHRDILDAKKGMEVGIKVTQRVHENDKVYKVA